MDPASNEGNFQDWARDFRYQFFSKLCDQHNLDKIAVAHHLDDQIETLLLRLLRGSGLTGLSSMRPRSENYDKTLIRPLLGLTRTEIEEALKEKGIPYRLDETNEANLYRRNRLRNDILPILREIQPGYEKAFGDSLFLMQSEDQLLDNLALIKLKELKGEPRNHTEKEVILSRKGLQSLPKSLRLRILRLVIGELTGGPQSITFHHINKMEGLLSRERANAQYDLPGRLLYEQGPHVIIIRSK
jgi:tRNA(Ile)-lysidine synthase TilS/MesJ